MQVCNEAPTNEFSIPGDGHADSNDSVADTQEKLARKATAARLARQRHKANVAGLEGTVASLTRRVAQLELQSREVVRTAKQTLHAELQSALSAEQWETLSGWLGQAETADANNERLCGEVTSAADDLMLLCSLKAKSIPCSVPTSTVPPTHSSPLSAVPAVRVQAHAAAAKERRASVTAACRASKAGGVSMLSARPNARNSSSAGVLLAAAIASQPKDSWGTIAAEPSPVSVIGASYAAGSVRCGGGLSSDTELACALVGLAETRSHASGAPVMAVPSVACIGRPPPLSLPPSADSRE